MLRIGENGGGKERRSRSVGPLGVFYGDDDVGDFSARRRSRSCCGVIEGETISLRVRCSVVPAKDRWVLS